VTGIGSAVLVVALSVSIVGGVLVGLRLFDRMMEGPTVWRRLPFLLPLLLLVVVEFVLVVEWRCALDLIDEDECILSH
jgi:uncharacterized protein (DUF983 family)